MLSLTIGIHDDLLWDCYPIKTKNLGAECCTEVLNFYDVILQNRLTNHLLGNLPSSTPVQLPST